MSVTLRMKMALAVLLALPMLSAPSLDAWAGPYDPPATYYSSATGTGSTLKSQLTTIMSTGHIQRSYGDFRYSAAITDRDPNNPNNILLVYDRRSVSATWDSGITWNREHVWPQSLQPGSASNSTKGNLGDPHALRPCDNSLNSYRSNYPYGMDNTTGSYQLLGSYFFPGDVDKGDIARQLFYSDTRWTSLGLSLVDTYPSGYQMGDLSSLVNWHYLDPPDEFERRRNHTIYSQAENPSYYTNNRNAFIDRPEYVWSVYVDQENDSSITLDGATPTDGATALDVDLGRVLVGAPMPGAQTLGITKSGSDGTYYEVTTSGLATSSISGRYNAFRNGATDSASIEVGLSGSTVTAGGLSGTVTIDNLDVTLNGGSGHGANDGDDTVSLSLEVLDHATASFSDVAQVSSLDIDFGSLTIGAAAPVLGFDLFNLVDTAGFTAGLDLDAIAGAGDTSVLSTDLALFGGASTLAAGSGSAFTATLDTSAAGVFSASYTLSFSDEDLPGAAALGDLTLNLFGEVTAPEGDPDFDSDRDVDLADLLIWQRGNGLPGTQADGDANGDGAVDGADLEVWQFQFAADAGASATAPVPEPGALGLCCVGILLLVRRVR